MSRAENRSRAEEEEAPHESLHCFRKNAQYDAPPARVELAKWVVVAHQRIQREVHCSICLAGFAPMLGFSLVSRPILPAPDFFGHPDAPRSMGAAAPPHQTPLTPGVWAFLDSPGSYTPVALSSTKLERLRGRFVFYF